MIAGINGVLKIRQEEPFLLDRSEGYVGVLIDDLVTKGTSEPYRLFTSRAEYRLLLRQDNADRRLMRYGHRLGLISNEQIGFLERKEKLISDVIKKSKKIKPVPEIINPFLERLNTTPVSSRQSLYQLLKRPQIHLADLRSVDEVNHLLDRLGDLCKEVVEQVEIEIKYEGYFQRQIDQVERFKRLEEKHIPETIEYQTISMLSKEAREKLEKIQPISLGQAARISGVSPADISILAVLLEKGVTDKSVPRGTDLMCLK